MFSTFSIPCLQPTLFLRDNRNAYEIAGLLLSTPFQFLKKLADFHSVFKSAAHTVGTTVATLFERSTIATRQSYGCPLNKRSCSVYFEIEVSV
jgi:hypothetical protein